MKWLCCVLFASFFFAAGCNNKLDERLEKSKSSLESLADFGKDDPSREYAGQILERLNAATSKSLQSPVIAYASIYQRASGEYFMRLYWIEDIPSVEKVEISFGPDKYIYKLDEIDKASAKSESLNSVVYHARWDFPQNENGFLSDLLEQRRRASVKLLDNRGQLSDAYVLSYSIAKND